MKQSRFTEAQIIGILKEQESGSPTAEVCRIAMLGRASLSDQATVWLDPGPLQ
jgi:putative transposase